MNQNERKQSNATHNQQQWFSTNFSLPCPQPGKFWQSLYWRKRLYLLGHFEDEYLMVMSYIYRHTHAGVGSISMASAADFCLHKLLFSAGTLLFSEDATYAYVAPCYYLHSTAARSKITDCPSAPCPFWPISSHVSFFPRLPNQLWLFPLRPTASMLRFAARDLIFLIFRFGIGLYKVRVSQSL